MPKTIELRAPSHHKLVVGDKVIYGGERRTLPDDVADELLTAPYADVREVDSEVTLTELRKRAKELDISGRSSMGKEQLLEAIGQAELDDQPDESGQAGEKEAEAAEGGEGPDNDNKEA